MCHAITSIKQEMCASRNMPVYINYQTVKKIIFIVMVTLTFDPKIKRVLPLRLPQGNHVVKFGKDPIYRTKVIMRKPVWMPAHRSPYPIT